MARRPFFSGNYQLGSNANAANLIAQAGAAQGKMLQNLGSDIGGAIEKYGLNKEKRAKLTDKIENRIKLDPSIVQRLTMSGDEDYDKKNLKLIEQLSTGELGLRRLETLDSAMATIKEIDLQNEKIEDRLLKTQFQQAIISEKENANELFDETKDLKKQNLKLERDRKIINNLMDRVEATKAYQIFPEAIKTELAELKERLNVTRDKAQERKYYTPGEQALNKKALEKIGIESAVESLDEQKQKNIDNKARSLVYSPTEQAQDEKAQADADLLATQNKKTLIPMRDIDGNIIANQFTLNNVPYTKSADGELSRIGTPSENITPPVASPKTTPPRVFDPVDAKAFRGQFTPQIVDTLDRAYSYLTGETLPGTDQKEVKKQIQNLSTIGNAITPVLLAELGGKVTNLMIQRVQDNIPLATDNVTKGREKIGQLVDLAKSQLSRAETFIETLNPGTQAYAEALGVKRFLEVNIPMLEQSIGADRPGFSDPSIERILGNNKKPNDLPIVPSNRSKLTTEDLLKML